MKKFAFILMGPHYDPKVHHAVFETKGQITNVFTVNNFAAAKERVCQCRDEGYGCLELCGAFGEEKTRELIALTDNQLALGFVTHLPEQDALFDAFFARGKKAD